MLAISVLLLVLVTNYMKTSRWMSRECLISLMRLGVGSLVWYFWARIVFPYLENLTGKVQTSSSIRWHVDHASGVCNVTSHVSKIDCIHNGYTWTGFDASGHCFLLSWNNLFMVEEFLISCHGLFSQDSQIQGKETVQKQPGML